ncbi:ABC transporter permease [Ensifer sp. ENS05]|uniref:ABC transporter permease n=1 Tax=Ensifer sp. ENS05 TaxID=2769277 RepID=UPI001786C28E|nr:ABC transporter permease [Ensifer sp. ENS05]MBD9597406.1 ABC transporter permease [Ensifer sp. ENS05]
MNLVSFLGAVEIGLIFSLVALGVFLSFRVLDFPDLTVDGSFPLGGAVASTLIVSGIDPLLSTACATIAGGMSGIVTAWLNVRFKILHLLASILTMIALFSINLRIMGRPNIALIGEGTVFDLFTWLTPLVEVTGLPARSALKVAALLMIVVVTGLLLARLLTSEFGLAMRATGANARMARANGVFVDRHTFCGMALSNGLVAAAGALFAQAAGFADVTMGTGTVISGLAAVILGETLFRSRSILVKLLACIVGAITYRIAIALALNTGWLGLQASDLNLVTAVLVGVALMLPTIGGPFRNILTRSARA